MTHHVPTVVWALLVSLRDRVPGKLGVVVDTKILISI